MSTSLHTFPTTIAYGAKVGPKFKTHIFQASSGYEQRNSVWDEGLITADVSTGIQEESDLLQLLGFFRLVRGRAEKFRFKDWSDYNITNQNIGTGDGSTTIFQLIKTYTIGTDTVTRNITHPVETKIINVTVGGSPVTENTDFTVDYDTGKFTFNVAPTNGVAVIVGSAEFDVPVRFDTDDLDITLEAFKLGVADSIPIVEVKQ